MITEDENGREIDLRDDDREPEPPDDEPLPIDLGQIARHYHEALAEDMSGIPEHCREALAAMPDLIAEVEQLRERLAAVEAMPTEHRYVVVAAASPGPDDPLTEEVSAEAAIREATSWPGGRALRRTVHLGPWQDLVDFSTEPPF